jgi:hypothetical protein
VVSNDFSVYRLRRAVVEDERILVNNAFQIYSTDTMIGKPNGGSEWYVF